MRDETSTLHLLPFEVELMREGDGGGGGDGGGDGGGGGCIAGGEGALRGGFVLVVAFPLTLPFLTVSAALRRELIDTQEINSTGAKENRYDLKPQKKRERKRRDDF